MKYDGVSKVVFLGEPCSGVKSFVSSFISTFAQSVFVDKKQLFISKVGRGAPLMDSTERITAQAETAYYANNIMSLDNVLSHNTQNFDDCFEFQVIIDSELCGRISFLNLLGQTDYYRSIVSDYGMSMAVIMLDGKKLTDSDSDIDMSGVFDKLKKLAECRPHGYLFSVLFAVSKADLFGVENTQSQDFFEHRCSCCKDMIVYCLQENIPYRFAAFSAASRITSKVFDPAGEVVDNPDYEPWNIDTVGLYIISNALPMLRSHYIRECAAHLDAIKENRGVYNSDSFRSFVETQYSREKLAELIKCRYQLDRYIDYSRLIVESIKGKTFAAKPL